MVKRPRTAMLVGECDDDDERDVCVKLFLSTFSTASASFARVAFTKSAFGECFLDFTCTLPHMCILRFQMFGLRLMLFIHRLSGPSPPITHLSGPHGSSLFKIMLIFDG